MNPLTPTTTRRRRPTHRTSLALAAALAAASLNACSDDRDELVGYEIDPTPHVGSLTLDEASNADAAYPLRAPPAGLLITFLGFTNCPDACPTALAEIRAAVDRLGDRAAPIDVAMITVDPERDTATVLTDYVRSVVPDAIALRTEDQDQLRRVVEAFGAGFEAEHDRHGAVSDVGHTDYTYLVDDTGDVALTWTAEMTTDDLVNYLDRIDDQA